MILAMFLAAQIQVIAHRAEHIHHAENSIPAIQSAIELGVDYVELDVRTTKDGKLILMHDKTVDRTTEGHGEVKDLSGDEVAQLKFKEFGGTVPTFDEALDAAKGRIKIYLDWKEATPEALFEKLQAHGMLDQVVVYGDHKDLKALQRLAPSVRVMPEAGPMLYLRMGEHSLKPKVVAFDHDDFKPDQIRFVLGKKEEIFVDRLNEQDTPQLWQDAIDKGVSGIQTNHPAELVQFLREKKLHP